MSKFFTFRSVYLFIYGGGTGVVVCGGINEKRIEWMVMENVEEIRREWVGTG